MMTANDARLYLIQKGFEESFFTERYLVTMPDGSFKVSLGYIPQKKNEERLPFPNKKNELLAAIKEIPCYIEFGKLMHNAKRLAYMMCSGVFIWFTTKEEFDTANEWFKIAFQRSLAEFVFVEEKVIDSKVYFFKGCPDITLRQQL